VTQRGGLRGSAAACYLRPAMERPNLKIETHVQVLKILFEGTRAVGVQGIRGDEVVELRAGSEVILSAGTYHSPQLLMLSGIGRPDELAPLQISPVAELPGVGLNLHDHPVAGAVYLSGRAGSLFGAMNEENMARFQTSGDGPLTSNGVESGGFARTRAGVDAPDIQLHCIPALIVDEGLVPGPAHGVTVAANVAKPASRGRVALVSPDPTAKPLIIHNYYAEPEDLRAQVAGIRICMQIAHTEPLAGWVSEPLIGPASDEDEDIISAIRARAQTAYHPVGTCKMGADDLAVVDLQLRVRGLEALRIVDASIMPTVPRGNTNAPTVALAEKAADLIRGRTVPSLDHTAPATA